MKKIISLFLSFLMVAALLPFNVWAAELEENAPAEENKIIEETEPVAEEEAILEEPAEEPVLEEEPISEEESVPEEFPEEEILQPEEPAEEEVIITEEASEEAETVLASDIVASGYCGGEGDGTNLTWTLDAEGTLTISGEGAMADYKGTSYNGVGGTSAPWGEHWESLQKLVIEEGVTSIGNYAFIS